MSFTPLTSATKSQGQAHSGCPPSGGKSGVSWGCLPGPYYCELQGHTRRYLTPQGFKVSFLLPSEAFEMNKNQILSFHMITLYIRLGIYPSLFQIKLYTGVSQDRLGYAEVTKKNLNSH